VLLGSAPPRIVLSPDIGRTRPVEDQSRDSLGARRGKEQAQRAGLGEADDCRPLRVNDVHHGADVVHPSLEIGRAADPVGESRPALVEHDEAAESREALEERGRRAFPCLLGQVRQHPAVDEHQIDRALADDGVGDVDVAAPRVTDLRGLHGD